MNYKNLLLAFIVLITIGNTSVSAQNFVWAKNAGATNNSDVVPNSMAVDASGNVYTTGFISGICDFDPSANTFNLTGNVNGQDVYIQKLDANGNFLWAKLIAGANSYSEAYTVKVDNAGNVYIVGSFDDVVDFDPGTAVNNITPQGFDAYILKLNSLGNFVWVKTFGSSNSAVEAMSLAIDANNDLILGGYYNDIVDFDPNAGVSNLTSLGFQEPFVLKLTAAGNYVWAKTMPVNNYGMIKAIDIDASNNIYCGGNYSGTIDLDPGTGINSVNSLSNVSFNFVVKLDNLGNHILGKSFGGNGDGLLTTVDIDNNNNIILGGTFSGTTDFDPGNTTYNLNSTNSFIDGYILKLNNSGAFSWAIQIDGVDDVELMGVDLDVAGSVFVTGYFLGTTDFDPSANTLNLTPSGLIDAYVLKLNNNGNYSYAHQLGGTIEDGGFDIALNNNDIYSVGIFANTADFDPSTAVNNLTTASDGDLYCFKWSQCAPTTNTINATGCSYTLNGQTYTANGSYTQVLTNAVGCDSIITINLTGSSTNTTLNPSVCSGSYTYNGQTYTTTGTYVQAHTNVAGCDSNTIINLTVGTTTYGSITDQGCGIYFFNNQFYFQSGTYQDTIVNSTGCDSIVTLNITINPTYSNVFTANSCGPYIFNGQTYTTTGNYIQNYLTTTGCDSTIYLDLTITPLPPTVFTQNSCTPYTLNGQTYTSSGVYNQLYTSSQGCDSTVQLNLTINVPNINVTQSGNTLSSQAAPPSTYQWIKCNPYSIINGANSANYTVTANGSYAVIVDLNGCKDTSACKTYTNVGINETYFGELTKIYPNPTDDLLNIEFTQSMKNLAIQITSITGQVLYSNQYPQINKLEYQTAPLAKGIYIIRLSDGEHSSSIRFTKN